MSTHTDQSALFAVCDDGTTVRVGRPSADWGRIQDRWKRFDDRRHYNARQHKVLGRLVRYFAVRSTNDPDARWTGAIPVRVADVRIVPDRPHKLVTARRGVGWQAFIVNDRGIVSARDLDAAPSSLRNLGEKAAILAARASARRRQII